jgi:hypothetical protein
VPAPLVVISPHFDDAGLSCVSLIANNPGAVLLTVFGGGPAKMDPISGWDAASQFHSGDDVVGIRRSEDVAACDLLRAIHVPFDFWDGQYRNETYAYAGASEGDELIADIGGSFDRALLEPGPAQGATRWAAPLGILHADHIATNTAFLQWAERAAEIELLMYEDLPYAAEFRKPRRAALKRVKSLGFRLESIDLQPTPGPLKAQVISCYESQLHALDGRDSLALRSPEVVYRLLRK